MEPPTLTDMLIATTWLKHHGSTWAWDKLNDLIETEPMEAWEIVRLMVAHAPDYGTLASVAAGPVEDLLSRDETFAPMRVEAVENRRFRICLGGAYGLPDDLQAFAESEAVREPLPAAAAYPTSLAEHVSLMVAWFHQSDTHWAATFLDERIKGDPDSAWLLLRILLRLSEDIVDRREDVFLHGLEPFVRRHLATHHSAVAQAAKRSVRLREWLMNYRRPPVDDPDLWSDFMREIA